MARLQHNRLGHYGPDAIDHQELLVSGRVVQTLHDGLFQGLQLLVQPGQDRETADDGQPLVGLREPPLACVLRSLVQPLGTEAHAHSAHAEVVQTEHVRVPHRPFGFGGDVSLGQHASA